jgi:hypothetical protein
MGQNLWHYADIGINYGKKGFMKLATGVNFINFFGKIYAPSGAT